MGRHAADRPGPDSRSPLHADLFTPNSRKNDADHYAVFDSLVAPHYDSLRDYVLRLTEGDEAAAESVLKEALYRAERDPSRYPQQGYAVRPWLVLIARTVFRDGERHEPAGHDDRPPPARRRAGGPLPTVTVSQAMEGLALGHREVLIKLFFRGVSLDEVAQADGTSVAAVKARLDAAMEALRVALDRQIAERPGPR
jgi:RNA polymerase sigma-70 factor (ECF subfamily)